MREADFLEALICGFLVALTAALFVEYFGVTSGSVIGGIAVGLIIVNFGILLLIAWPFKFPGMVVFFVIVMVLGYAAYGPYASYIRGPMKGIGESMSDLPEMAEKQMHCLMLIFTNPMAYQTECVISNQPPAPEEKPENFGLEVTEFQMQPDTEIYAGMPMQIWMTLENKGSYDATNVSINSDGGKYEVCENLEVLNITEINGNYSDKIRKETNHYFSLTGKVNDPWDEEVECTYAKNKMVIGGDIKTTYSYDYQTESYLEIEAIKNVNETIPKFKVNSAKEKAAPANTLMYTFVPLIWEGAGEGFREGIIPINFKNERRKGKITFRGKYVHYTTYLSEISKESWCDYTCSEIDEPNCMEDCKRNNYANVTLEETDPEKTYHHCEIWKNSRTSSTGKRVDGINNDKLCEDVHGYYDKEECRLIIRIKLDSYENPICNNETCKEIGGEIIEEKGGNGTYCLIDKIEYNETDCNLRGIGGKPIYEVKGKYERSHRDKITIYIVGDVGNKGYVSLSCGEGKKDVVTCIQGTNKVELIWKNDKLNLKPDEKKFVYSGVKVSLKSWPEDTLDLNFGIKADATYRVEMERTDHLQIRNPHYTD